MLWSWIRVREGARWVLRGSSFGKLERDIERMAAPLAHGALSDRKAARTQRRIAHALGYLPIELAEKHHDMMARFGHHTRTEQERQVHQHQFFKSYPVAIVAPPHFDAPPPNESAPLGAAATE